MWKRAFCFAKKGLIFIYLPFNRFLEYNRCVDIIVVRAPDVPKMLIQPGLSHGTLAGTYENID